MSRFASFTFAAVALTAAACVTINVYFPAAAAEKAADRIIDDVWKQPAGTPAAPAKTSRIDSNVVERAFVAVGEFILPSAQAQGQPNIDISSPELQRLKAQMEGRFAALKPHFDSGAVGLTGDGLVTVRDPNAVPLPQRNAVKSLVSEENADRKAMYKEIAVANGQPQWEGQIQSVFAQRWVAKAPAGWWYEDSSGWKKK